MAERCKDLKSEELNFNEVLGYLKPDQMATYLETQTQEKMRKTWRDIGLTTSQDPMPLHHTSTGSI